MNTQNDYKNDINLPEGVTWEGIIELIKEEKYQNLLQKIDPDTFRFVLEESNRPKVIETLLKVLEKTEPENATKEHAEKIVRAMQEIAKIYI